MSKTELNEEKMHQKCNSDNILKPLRDIAMRNTAEKYGGSLTTN